jgi:ribosome-binding factor A
MARSDLKERKVAQKEALIFREFSKLFLRLALDDKNLQDFSINRVSLSKDKGIIAIYFYTPGGQAAFDEKKDSLVLYKPSLRKALAQVIPSRYTPELVFKYDHLFEKQKKIDDLLEALKEEESL